MTQKTSWAFAVAGTLNKSEAKETSRAILLAYSIHKNYDFGCTKFFVRQWHYETTFKWCSVTVDTVVVKASINFSKQIFYKFLGPLTHQLNDL